MKVVKDILSRNGLETPDGRPIHAYNVTNEEFKKLKQSLGLMMGMVTDSVTKTVAQGFTIYASEHIRRNLAGGHPKWEPVFSSVGIHKWALNFERKLTDTGLKTWGRKLRVSEYGRRQFIYTLMAEGGLPDALMQNAGHYQDMMLALVREVESEGTLGEQIAPLAARRYQYELPQAFQSEDTTRLLAELALALVEIRSWIAEDLPEADVIAWLEANHPTWKQKLPLRLSDETIEALIRPVLKAEKIKPRVEAALVTRLLRRSCGRDGWVGLACIADGGFVQRSLIPGAGADKRLRIRADDNGISFLAVPETGGWRLSGNGGRGDAYLAAAPHQAIVASAYIDGIGLGEITLDPGLPSPEESLSLWRPAKTDELDPDELVLLSGRGRTRAAAIWVLGPENADASALGAINLSSMEKGPSGGLWRASGNGQVDVGGQTVALATGQDNDAEPVRMVASGRTLPAWTSAGAQVFLGQPKLLGAEGEVPLRQIGGLLTEKTIRGSLAARIYEWVEEDAVLSRLRLVVLPADVSFRMREPQPGVLHFEASGLTPGWHMALSGGSYVVRERVSDTGHVVLDLKVDGAAIGIVALSISDPRTGDDLELSALWPSTGARIITPEGTLLTRNTDLSVGWLEGWRAHLPDQGGAVQIRLSGQGQAVAFHASGTNRLNAYRSMIQQILSLEGPDAQVNLRAVSVTETNRLQIRNYGWDGEESHPFRILRMPHSRLTAVDLENPTDVRETTAGHRIDMEGWLGSGERLWYVQGRSDEQGDMRPFVWTLRLQPPSIRTSRITDFQTRWENALADESDPFWEQSWQLIMNVRAGGSANGLDQVVALGKVPAAAVALLFRCPVAEVAAVLYLEEEAPFWWPSVTLKAWRDGIKHGATYLRSSLGTAGLPAENIQSIVQDRLFLKVDRILSSRPELAAHIGLNLLELEFAIKNPDSPAIVAFTPLAKLNKTLKEAANNALQRFDQLPSGAAHIEASFKILENLSDEIRPLLDAPTVVAEVVMGRKPPLQPHKMLQIFALRAADPTWFDTAMPAIISYFHKMSK